MKKLLTFVMVTMVIMMVGCTDNKLADEPVSVHTVVICGCRSNSCYTSFLDAEQVKEAIMESTLSYGTVSLIVADGAPYMAERFEVEASQKKLSDKKKADIAEAQAEQIIQAAMEVEAVTEESDMLKAIQLGARSLKNEMGDKRLLIIDSGLSTAGRINCLDIELLEMGLTDEHLEFLEQEKELPELDDVTVLWLGLGDVVANQMPCSESVRDTLIQIWEAVCCKAEAVVFSDVLPGNEGHKNLPHVTVVPYPETKNFTPVVFNEEKLMFQADSVELVNKSAAEEALLPLVDELKTNELQIAIFGTTASVGENRDCIKFSQKRAEVIRDLMIDMGLQEHQIAVARGLGYENIFYVQDRLMDGTLDAVAAKENRSVIIMSVDDAHEKGLI